MFLHRLRFVFASLSIPRLTTAIALAAMAPGVSAAAQSSKLIWIPGSSVKQQQIIGDYDWAALSKGVRIPTPSQTIKRFNIAGMDLGCSVEHKGDLLFLFGDTISNDPTQAWGASSNQPFAAYQAGDAFATSKSTDPSSGLTLDFFTHSDGTPLFVQPPGINMGPDNVPNSGISLNGKIYLICATGAIVGTQNPHAASSSYLATFDETTQAFTAGRLISKLHPKLNPHLRKQGHFITNSLHAYGQNVLMFGLGEYRASDVYLSMTPVGGFEPGVGTQYFAGINRLGAPIWKSVEQAAYPIVFDKPLNNQDNWPYDYPTIGNVSVVYAKDLHLWLMTYDGGRQFANAPTAGIYFTYADDPWGLWSTPQLIYNAERDNGLGAYIRDPNGTPHGPAGPTIGKNPPDSTHGGDYAPYMIERFITVHGTMLRIYYTMSTWNPYTVLLMHSDFTIVPRGIHARPASIGPLPRQGKGQGGGRGRNRPRLP